MIPNWIPTATSRTKRSLSECIDSNGNVDALALLLYHRRRQKERNAILDLLLQKCRDIAAKDEKYVKESKPSRSRSCFKKVVTQLRLPDGSLVDMTPKTSPWYVSYVLHPKLGDEKFEKKFRLRFRCTYEMFEKLFRLIKENDLFDRWSRTDAAYRPSSPLQLLVLGALRYIGRGWTFDDLEESTAISEETHRQFFHIFIEWGSSDFFKQQVILPNNTEEWKAHVSEFAEAGLQGCVASMDATHVGMHRCPNSRWNHHKGPKLNMPSRTYNVCVNHRRRILSTTCGHPARWNDKTLVLYDTLAVGLKKGTILQDYAFNLLERTDEGNIVEVPYRGAYMITDNGYLRWASTIPPFKDTPYNTQVRWSKWVESMRKDVECCFGILKGRFRILKTGIRLHGIEACDRIWLTCCALHNFLLTEDGMDYCWKNGVPTDWEGEAGLHNPDDVIMHSAIDRINNLSGNELRRYDTSGHGFGSDCIRWENDDDYEEFEESDHNEENEDNVHLHDNMLVRVVPKLSQDYFRDRLVEHFDILFSQKKIVWPSRIRLEPSL
jgi:hypothetical protein